MTEQIGDGKGFTVGMCYQFAVTIIISPVKSLYLPKKMIRNRC